MQERYGWTVSADDVREHTDLLQALQLVLHLATSPGDAVALQTPNYPPFLATLETMGRRGVGSPWTRTTAGWAPTSRASPTPWPRTTAGAPAGQPQHNPTGRVLTRAELDAIAAIARRHDLLVFSDEIHAELTYEPHRHIPFASLHEDAAARTVTLTSATKAFNLAGLRCSVAHYGSEQLLALRDSQPPDLYGTVSTLGVAGTLAAWRHGAEWQDRLLRVLDRNRRRVRGGACLPPPATTTAPCPRRPTSTGSRPTSSGSATSRSTRSSLAPGCCWTAEPASVPAGSATCGLNFATSAPLLDEILTRLASVARR